MTYVVDEFKSLIDVALNTTRVDANFIHHPRIASSSIHLFVMGYVGSKWGDAHCFYTCSVRCFKVLFFVSQQHLGYLASRLFLFPYSTQSRLERTIDFSFFFFVLLFRLLDSSCKCDRRWAVGGCVGVY